MPGIEQTKDVLKFMIGLAEAGVKTFEDHKITIGDIPTVVGALVSLPSAIAGLGEVPAELKDMDETERQELIDYAKDEFDIPDDKIEAIVEDSLVICGMIYTLVLKIKG